MDIMEFCRGRCWVGVCRWGGSQVAHKTPDFKCVQVASFPSFSLNQCFISPPRSDLEAPVSPGEQQLGGCGRGSKGRC